MHIILIIPIIGDITGTRLDILRLRWQLMHFSFIANQQYYYDEGVFYQPSSGGYSVVAAPIGATVVLCLPAMKLPWWEMILTYYYGGVFYIYTGSGYQVVAAPIGAVVTQIPGRGCAAGYRRTNLSCLQ